MDEILLTQHADNCSSRKVIKNSWDCFCENNPEHFLFFYNNQFKLVTYFSCISQYCPHLSFKEDIIKACLDKYKVYNPYEVGRWHISEHLIEVRNRGASLKKWIEEINYLYEDNAGKEYAITTKTDFHICCYNQEERDDNYIKAKKYLEDNYSNHKNLFNQLDALYKINISPIQYMNERDIATTIDQLKTVIKQKLKPKKHDNKIKKTS